MLGAGREGSRRSLRVACLGSGSRGNSTLIEAGETAVLVDAGFSGVQLSRRLESLGYSPDDISAVIVTHEHRDHTGGIGVAARRWGWPLHLTAGTASGCATLFRGAEELVIHDRDSHFSVGNLAVQLVPTCHDASDPVAVRLTDSTSGLTAGVATDIGRATAAVRDAFRGCNFLVLESNHDEVKLREAKYPWSLKQRIGGSRGHLSNRLAGDLAAELAHPELGGILLVHLSEECNESAAALHDVRRALRRVKYRGTLATAHQEESSPWFDVRALSQVALNHGPQLQLFAT